MMLIKCKVLIFLSSELYFSDAFGLANGGTTIDSVTYTLDDAGNRITRTQSNQTYSYAYDNLYRLIQATPTSGTNPTEVFSYDLVCNRLTSSNDQLSTANSMTNYSYDDENRLTGVTRTQNNLVRDEIGTDCQSSNTYPRTVNHVYDNQNIILEYDQAESVSAARV